jgi:PadR family transcriptional regulator, regulatory protein PadR
MLGEFEYLLITAAAGFGDERYGAAIRQEIGTVTGRKCSIGSLYTTFDRLETRGFLKTWMGDAWYLVVTASTKRRTGEPHGA